MRPNMLAPVLVLAALLGGFMVADKLWLHWYTPDTAGTTIDRTAKVPTASASQSPSSTAGTTDLSTEQPPATASQNDLQGSAPPPSAQSRDAFAALWLVSQQATYRVRYETSSTDGEKGDSYVVFNRPPSARVDTIAEGGDEPSSQIIVGPDGSTFACSFDDGERSCGKVEPFAGPLPLTAGPIVFPAGASFGSITVSELDSKTIAGVSARCFRVASADAADTTDYCFNAEAVPVYARGGFGIIEASELSSVSDADFDLPATN